MLTMCSAGQTDKPFGRELKEVTSKQNHTIANSNSLNLESYLYTVFMLFQLSPRGDVPIPKWPRPKDVKGGHVPKDFSYHVCLRWLNSQTNELTEKSDFKDKHAFCILSI